MRRASESAGRPAFVVAALVAAFALPAACAQAIQVEGDGDGGGGGEGGGTSVDVATGPTSAASTTGEPASSSASGSGGAGGAGASSGAGGAGGAGGQAGCAANEVLCAGQCTDPSTDPQNCGMCGLVCPLNTICAAGACVAGCCGEVQNDFPPTGNCFQGAAWVAWEYTPSCTFNVKRIEVHSGSGSLALLDDANNFPGPTLFQGVLGQPDAQGWIGVDMPSMPLMAGKKYWLAVSINTCSHAISGSLPVYYGSFNTLNGPWEGPYQQFHWTARYLGECM
jgi:hypothetical protein